MSKLRHPNIVSYFGSFIDQDNTYIVMELLSLGSLDRLLQNNSEKIQTLTLINLSLQIADGMMFLEENYIIHRDLALRNILVGGQSPSYIIKVSDFGLSRTTGDLGYYKSESKAIPYKWCSPEIIQQGLFSHKSDVWAFGILLWELFSYGNPPYPGMLNSETVEHLLPGSRLHPPANCSIEISELMIKCWSHKPEDRPSFKEIISQSISKKNTSQITPDHHDTGEPIYHHDTGEPIYLHHDNVVHDERMNYLS